MLCGMAGLGAVRTDNEGQTLAGLGAASVGGPCLEAIIAGGFTQPGKKTAKEGVEERNKNLQLNLVETFFKNHSLQKINEDTEQLDVHYTVYISVMNRNKKQRESLNH